MPVNLDRDRTLETGLFSTERFAQPPIELRIAGFPKPITHMHAVERNVAVAERERRFRPACLDAVNPAALLFLVGVSGIEHHAIAWFERRFKMHDYLASLDPLHLTKIYTALFSKPRVRQFLIVDAAEPTGVKPPRKAHLKVVAKIFVDFGDRPSDVF